MELFFSISSHASPVNGHFFHFSQKVVILTRFNIIKKLRNSYFRRSDVNVP
jgi:hypothetical protein